MFMSVAADSNHKHVRCIIMRQGIDDLVKAKQLNGRVELEFRRVCG
jgi:hypothetical protein